MQTLYSLEILTRLPLSKKFLKFMLEIKWNEPFRFAPTGIFGIPSGGGLC